MSDYGVSLMVLIAIGFVPASFISYPIRERKREEKRVQLVTGIPVFTYWLAMTLWDGLVNNKTNK